MADIETESVIDSLRAVYKTEAKGETESPEAPEPEVSEPELEVEAEDTEEEVSLGAESEEVEAAAEDEPEDEEPEEVFQPPEHWSSDEKETFRSLPQEAQEILIERDKSFQRGYQERVQAISDIEKAASFPELLLAVAAFLAFLTLAAFSRSVSFFRFRCTVFK